MTRSSKQGSEIEAIEMPGLSTSPLSPAVVAGGMIFSSGMTGRDRSTGNVPEGFEHQAEIAITNLEDVIEAAGGSLDTVLKTTVFLVDAADFAAMNKVYASRFKLPPPARSTLIVAALAKPNLKFEIEAVARRR